MVGISELQKTRVAWYVGAQGHSIGRSFTSICEYGDKKGLEQLVEIAENAAEEIDRARCDCYDTEDIGNQLSILLSTYYSFREKMLLAASPLEEHTQLQSLLDISEKIIIQLYDSITKPEFKKEQSIIDIIKNIRFDIMDLHPEKKIAIVGKGDIILSYIEKNDDDTPLHYCSFDDIFLLFYNIINNAVENMEKGTINTMINHKPNEGYATVIIENSGSYISEDNLKKFNSKEPFTSKPDGKGGKGMKIVYDLLERYNGVLRVTSDMKRMITRFEIDLPYKIDTKPLLS